MSDNNPPYTLVLTHDVDHLSLAKYPLFSKDTISFFKRNLFNNLLRCMQGEISLGKYLNSIKWCLVYPLVKLGIHEDPWEKAIIDLMALEKRYGVRATYFFIPMPFNPGHKSKGVEDDKGREARYDIEDHRSLLQRMQEDGFEAGVHGIDAHIDTESAKQELDRLRKLLPDKEKVGLRMHWLYQPEQLWPNLREAGFHYDATYGSNHEVGFYENQYRPFVKDGIWVFPLTIMDSTLMGNWRMNLSIEDAWEKVKTILDKAREKEAVITVNWHTDHFYVFDYWGEVYERLLNQAKSDGARIVNCSDYLEVEVKKETSCV